MFLGLKLGQNNPDYVSQIKINLQMIDSFLEVWLHINLTEKADTLESSYDASIDLSFLL